MLLRDLLHLKGIYFVLGDIYTDLSYDVGW